MISKDRQGRHEPDCQCRRCSGALNPYLRPRGVRRAKPAKPDTALATALRDAMAEAEAKAWQCLAKYKFYLFGYYAARWVTLNRLSGINAGNPWKPVVTRAKQEVVHRHAFNQPMQGEDDEQQV